MGKSFMIMKIFQFHRFGHNAEKITSALRWDVACGVKKGLLSDIFFPGRGYRFVQMQYFLSFAGDFMLPDIRHRICLVLNSEYDA